MTSETGNQVNFEEEGVVISLPAGARNLRAKSLPISVPASAQSVTDFHIIRFVINVVIFDRDKPDRFLSRFDSPFELQVRYSADDLQEAQTRGGTLSLAAYVDDHWVRITPQKHQFSLQADSDPSAGGVGTARIRDWGDPPIAWVV